VSVVLGLALAAGLVLVASPWFWPRRARPANTRPGIVNERLVQAGLPGVGAGVVAAVCGTLALTAGAAAQALIGVVPLSLALAVVAGLAPVAVIGSRARAFRRASRAVWPDVVDQLVSAVRSGLALPEALAPLSSSGPDVTRVAFTEFAYRYRSTGSFSLAVDELKGRLADPVADRLVETMRMARDVGGVELPGILRGLGAQLRREAAIRSEVEGRQSWVVNAARLGVAAPWVVLLLLATRPEAAAAYNSPQGMALVVGGLLVSVVAYRLMLRVGRLPEERRWFA
jgi:tight adherence protein B